MVRVIDSGVSKPEFLFVDYQKNNPRNPTNAQKHALYQRKRKQASIDRLKNSTQPQRQLLRFRYKARTEGEMDISSEAPIVDNEAARQSEISHMVEQQTAIIAGRRSPKTYLSEGFVDPFSSSALPMTKCMNSYFYHCMCIAYIIEFSLTKAVREHTIVQCYPLDITRMGMWWWQQAITQPALLQALLCSAASHQMALVTLSSISDKSIQRSGREFLRLRGDTMNTLNNILRDSMQAAAESTTLVVGTLVAIEVLHAP
jgi:hypothetical protein